MLSHSNNVNISGGEFTVNVAKTPLTPDELKIKNAQKGKDIFVHF